MSNQAALQRAMRADANITGDLPASGLKVDQVEAFYEMASTTERNSKFFSQIPRQFKTPVTGSLPRINIGSRIIRQKTQAVDDGYRSKVTTDSVSYATTAFKLPMEIAEEVFEQNILGEGYESKVLQIATAKVGVEVEDLVFNGDATTDPSDDDYQFLSLNNGLVKLVTDGGNTLNGATYNSGQPHENMFYDAAALISGNNIVSQAGVPEHGALANTDYRWLMSWTTFTRWQKYIAARADQLGMQAFQASVGSPLSPLGIPITIVGANFPNTRIMLAKPKNFNLVYNYNLRVRKTVEGREAVMRDVRFYVIHGSFDVVVMEADASAIIYGLSA